MAKDQQEIRRKLRILDHAAASGDVSKTCRYFGIGRASFYRWRHALADHGEAGLANKRSVPHNHPNRTPEAVTVKVLHLRRDVRHQRGLRQSMPSSRYPSCAAEIATAAPVLPAGQMNFPASSRLM